VILSLYFARSTGSEGFGAADNSSREGWIGR
jgi:hypothetical protein